MRSRTLLSLCLLLFLAGLANAQDYVGSTQCGLCHADAFATWVESGHHWKLNEIVNNQPPDYPFSAVPDPPASYTWSDISYVIGGYYWKARFIDQQGYIITGNTTQPLVQYNLWNQSWSTYNTGVQLSYSCGNCHTTGYSASGHQNNMPGIAGTWAEDGVGCEACHGPGGDHIGNPFGVPMSVDTTKALCGQCHYRDAQHRIVWKNGFIDHHEQYDELLHSPHAFKDCDDCHVAHKSTVYDLGGIRPDFACTNCHDQDSYLIAGMESLACWDCHMPFASKSALALNTYKADVRSHIFNIITTPTPRDSVIYDSAGTKYMKLDEEGYAQLTLDYVCISCHTTMTLNYASSWAEDIHTAHQSGVRELAQTVQPQAFAIVGAFPNPFNPKTIVEFTLNTPELVRAELYDTQGRLVNVAFEGRLEPGKHHLDIEGQQLATGIYILRLNAGRRMDAIKLALLK